MKTARLAGILATTLIVLLMSFHLLLAAGLPWGRAAWGGHHEVLAADLRWGSLAAAFVLGIAAWMVLARADLVAPRANSRMARTVTWVFVGYFTLNIIGNLLSTSGVERAVMTPVTVALAACFVLVSRS